MNNYQQNIFEIYKNINENNSSISELWFSQLEAKTLKENKLSISTIQSQFPNAQKRCLRTLCKSILREGIFSAPENLLTSNNNAYLNLDNSPLTLKIENIKQVRYGLLEDFTALTLTENDKLIFVLDDPMKLLALLSIHTDFPLQEIERFAHELLNSMLNDALFLSYRSVWGNDLKNKIAENEDLFFWSWLQKLKTDKDKCLLLEQWGTVGHPIHPGVKCKQDLTAQQVLTMSPEFQRAFRILCQANSLNIQHAI